MAKERGVASTANVGLLDLCASVIKHFLAKDSDIRISSSWDLIPLPESHISYAALDVYATWLVFKALTSSEPITGTGVDTLTPGGTAVSLFSADGARIIAHGQILPDCPSKFNGVNVTKTRVLIVVNTVIVPGHLVSNDLLPGKEDLPLSSFSPTPFQLLCKAKHLQIRDMTGQTEEAGQSHTSHTASLSQHAAQPAGPATYSNEPEERNKNLNSADIAEPWYTGAENDTPLSNEQKPELSFRDSLADIKASHMLQLATQSSSSDNILHSRVLGDIWHLMHQFSISQAHSLRRPFARALRNAFFKYDPEDHANLEVFLQSKKVTWDQMLCTYSSWILWRVRRFVPPPEELLPRITKVLYDFGPLMCSKSKQTLFNDKAWEVAKNVCENIRRGYYSDPPGIQLYYSSGKDKYGLLTYRCCRGTNAIEGGVHQNVIRWFGAFNAAPDLAMQLLRDYTLYHNLKAGHTYICLISKVSFNQQVGTPNRTGKPYVGSYDIWTQNQISSLINILSTQMETLPAEFGPGGWVNGDQYIRSNERFGILPIPASI